MRHRRNASEVRSLVLGSFDLFPNRGHVSVRTAAFALWAVAILAFTTLAGTICTRTAHAQDRTGDDSDVPDTTLVHGRAHPDSMLHGADAARGVPGQGRAGGPDSTVVQDALYARPFIGTAAGTSVGGYVEGNTNYFVEDGITDGFSMELRRFNIFLFANVSRRIKFLSELEFEHGTEEIALETALLDVQIDPALVLRGGIILPPIGAFNQNHDSPLWEFVERPLVSTEIIPSTLSEIGFGVYGRVFHPPVTLTYDLYLTNGLGDGVISNGHGRTHLASGRREEQFEADNNGSPALSGRLAARHGLGEIGLSFYTGIYNTFQLEGEDVDQSRRVTLLAVDYAADVVGIELKGETALAQIQIPESLIDVFGARQWGGHLDVIIPLWRPRVLGYDRAVLNGNLRLEAVDFNVGTFASTGKRIYDELYAIVPGFSFRPTPGTVFRANYRRHWYRDLPGNPAVRTGGLQIGFASYF